VVQEDRHRRDRLRRYSRDHGIIVAFVVELARGHNGQACAWLGAIAGITCLAAVAILRFRS
jgi:hypothetical protein